ncbi:hypothetical protein DFS34DRAFT_661398, partial [Phlyctochytrium arcticum]
QLKHKNSHKHIQSRQFLTSSKHEQKIYISGIGESSSLLAIPMPTLDSEHPEPLGSSRLDEEENSPPPAKVIKKVSLRAHVSPWTGRFLDVDVRTKYEKFIYKKWKRINITVVTAAFFFGAIFFVPHYHRNKEGSILAILWPYVFLEGLSIITIGVLLWLPLRWGARIATVVTFTYLFSVYVVGSLYEERNALSPLELQPLELTVTYVVTIAPHLEWHYKAISLITYSIAGKFILVGCLQPRTMLQGGGILLVSQITLAVFLALHSVLRRELREKQNFILILQEATTPLDGTLPRPIKANIGSLDSVQQPPKNVPGWKRLLTMCRYYVLSAFRFICGQRFRDPEKEGRFEKYCAKLSHIEHKFMYASAALSSFVSGMMMLLRHGPQSHNVIGLGAVVPAICIMGLLLKELPVINWKHPKREQAAAVCLHFAAQIATFVLTIVNGMRYKQSVADGNPDSMSYDAFVSTCVMLINIIISRSCIDGLRGKFAFACAILDIAMGLVLEYFSVGEPFLFGGPLVMMGMFVGLIVQPNSEKELRLHHHMLAPEIKAGIRSVIPKINFKVSTLSRTREANLTNIGVVTVRKVEM